MTAPVRAAADTLRRAIAARIGVTGLVALDQAADLPWLLDTAEHILDVAEHAGRNHDRPDVETRVVTAAAAYVDHFRPGYPDERETLLGKLMHAVDDYQGAVAAGEVQDQ